MSKNFQQQLTDDLTAATLETSLLGFAELIMGDARWLSQEMGSSHVIRSLVCLLAGMPPLDERKSKGTKSYEDNKQVYEHFYVPVSFHECLLRHSESLSLLRTEELQQLIANAPSNAFLTLLLRVLSTSTVFEGTAAMTIAQGIVSQAFGAADSFYLMAGHQGGSFFLETVLKYLSVTTILPLVSDNLVGQVMSYANDRCGNFVLQAAFNRLATELTALSSPSLATDDSAHKRKKKSSSSSSEDDIVIQLQLIAKQLLLEMTTAEPATQTTLVTERGGVCLAMLSLLHAMPDEQELAKTVAEMIIAAWTTASGEEVNSAAEYINSKLIPTVPTQQASSAPRHNYQAQQQQSQQQPVAMTSPSAVLLCRLLGQLQVSQHAPTALTARNLLSSLSPMSLKTIATSGGLARSCLDPFLLHCTPLQLKAMSSSLSQHAVVIATHPAGLHVLRSIYTACDLRGRERWAELLSKEMTSSQTLQRSREGRQAIQLVASELYARDASAWRQSVKKQLKASDLFQELAADNSNKENKSSSKSESKKKHADRQQKEQTTPEAVPEVGKATDTDNEDDDDNDDGKEQDGSGETGAKKRKRKRKRAGKKEGV